MYRQSDKSENAPSRTAITGQHDKLPREGMKSNNVTRSIPQRSSANFTREMNQVSRNNQTRSFNTVGNGQIRNSTTRVMPATRGYNNDGVQNRNVNRPAHPADPRVMSQTQRIPSTGRAPAYQPSHGSSPRKIPAKILILRFIRKYRNLVAIALACLLFLSISVPLMAFALTDVSDKTSKGNEATYEVNADKGTTEKGNSPSENNGGNVVSGDDSDSADDSKPSDDPDSTPVDSTNNEKDPESTEGISEVETDKDESSAEAETEDPNKGKFPVTIAFYDREAITCYTKPATLRQILANEGCVLKDSDRPTVDLDEMINYQSWIMIDSVSYKQVTESEPIPFKTETYESDTVPRGTVRTVSWGVNGSTEKVYTVEYVNGKEVNRTFQYEYVASYPTNQIDYYGVGGTFTASDGTVYSYSYRVEVRATYYNIHGNTYTGMPTGHNVVAVDPNVFPLGTEMYVLSDEFDMGYRIAADIGGAVKGNLFDIWMDETNPDYIRFAHQGVVNMTAYVLG